MTEAEILSNAIQAAQATAAIFSLFLTIVSAYIAALYFFLNRAPCLRSMAFALLSIAFVALGALAVNMQYLGEGLHTAWLKSAAESHRHGVAGAAYRRALAVPGWPRGRLLGRMGLGRRRLPRAHLPDLPLPLAAAPGADPRTNPCRHPS